MTGWVTRRTAPDIAGGPATPRWPSRITREVAMPAELKDHGEIMLKDAPAQVEDTVVAEFEGVRIYAPEPARAPDPQRLPPGAGADRADRRAAPRAGLRRQARAVHPGRRAPP